MNDSGMNEYTDYYKRFQIREYEVRGFNGKFKCPFCACKEEGDYHYTHLLQHAIRAAGDSISGKQRANHFALARYLAIDLAHEVKAEADQLSQSLNNPLQKALTGCKRLRLGEDGSKLNNSGNKGVGDMQQKEIRDMLMEISDRVSDLEMKNIEMTDKINYVMESLNIDELLGVRRELIKGLRDIQRGNNVEIGIKKIGKLDSQLFISELEKRFPHGDIEIQAVELCTDWQAVVQDPQWHPFETVEDDEGNPQRLLKEDDTKLQLLKQELGQEIHDAVVEAKTDLLKCNPSGCCWIVTELWNFNEKRKAALDEVIRHVFQLEAVKGKPRTQLRKKSKG